MTIRFVADVGSNHNSDMSRIDTLIRSARAIGCQAVKFQLFHGDRLYAPEFPDKIAAAQAQELPPRFIPEIASICRSVGIEFHCTPFCVDDVYMLRSWVDAFKIASYSILDLKLIKAACSQGLPVGISTGGASVEEVKAARMAAREEIASKKLIFYNCFPEYPAKLRPGMMNKINGLYILYTGYSDHTRRTEVILAAIAAGASIVEFHLDLNDRAGAESIHGHCWKIDEAHQMIDSAQAFNSILNGIEEQIDYTEMRQWRNDPGDELRPLKEYRNSMRSNKSNLERLCTEGIAEQSGD